MGAITLFDTPVQLPSYLQTSALAKSLAKQVDGGLAGNAINRISLRNGKFRFNKAGVEVGVLREPHLDVVVIAANPAVSRAFYIKAFDPDDSGVRPDCYSKEGVKPEDDVPAKQSPLCATCPKNAAGSATNGKGKACSYKKRIVTVHPSAIGGDAYAIDVAAMGMFGEDEASQKLFNLKNYIAALKANGLIVPAVVTRLSFDDEATVPKLFFTPIRTLTAEEWALVEVRAVSEDVRGMLDDIDNKAEEGQPVGQLAAPATLGPPLTNPAAPAPARRGRKPAAETPPTPAPAPTAAPAATAAGGFAFGNAAASSAAPAQAVAPTATAPAGGFSLDLDEFDK